MKHMVIIWFSVFSFWKTWNFSKTGVVSVEGNKHQHLDVCLTSTVHSSLCAWKNPFYFFMFFLLEVIYKSSVERARMKSSASSAKAPKAPTSTRRRRQLDYLDYLQSQFPLSLCPLKDRIKQIRFQHFIIWVSLQWIQHDSASDHKDEIRWIWMWIFNHFHPLSVYRGSKHSRMPQSWTAQVWKEHASDCTRRTITNSCSVPSQMAISKSCRSALRLSRTTLRSLIASWYKQHPDW